jgi:hypothetical protein
MLPFEISMNINNFTQLFNVMFFAVVSILFLFIIGCSTSGTLAKPKLLPAKIHITMNNSKPSGQDWDIVGSAPDPYVIVDGRSFRNERCRDSYKCIFSVYLFGDGPFNIEVWEADTTYDDSAGVTLCKRGSVCHTSGASVKVY